MTRDDCDKVIGAAYAAWAAGTPFSRYVTIAWGKSGCDPRDSVKLTGAFIKKARDWFASRGHPMPWAWVQEHGLVFGAHCHLLHHVPAELEELWRPMPFRFVKALLPGPYVAETCQSQRLPEAYRADRAPEHYEAVMLGKVHYMLKCAPADLEYDLGMIGNGPKPWGQRCKVYGKRAAAWQGWRG